MEFQRISTALGAEVGGIDLTRVLSGEERAVLAAGLVEHQVLFFRDQALEPADHLRLAEYFGPARPHAAYPTVPGYPGITVLESDRENPSRIEKWHTDMTFLPNPPLGSILRARIVPARGGDTLWMSLGAAYDALPSDWQTRLLTFAAEHSFVHGFRESLEAPGGEERLAEAVRAYPPVQHPVVCTHPVSGRRLLFVNSLFTKRIVGVSPRESEKILGFLFAHLERPEFQVRFSWRPDSIAFWDNRQTQHCPINDYWPAHRLHERVTIEGEKPS
ncbi:MAG: TauD/TfdA family dioxygenase [Candidatus Binatia bacterium]|nr:TauD/TfdA family dioxygenase [Candidatus Binatia bacterium]MDG2011211.1 TauD/TfdA family dioxygenase [Candidatus Binatia bacterium]